MPMSFHRTMLAALATTLVLVFLGQAPAASAYLEVVEGAAEISELELKSNRDQTVYARECDECPMLTLSVGPNTQYFDGRRRVALSSVAGQARGATVFFDPVTRKVTRILFWQ